VEREHDAGRYRLRTQLGWFGATLVGLAACGGANHDELLAPRGGGGGQVSPPQGGTSSPSGGTGGEPSSGADAGAGGQVSSGGEATGGEATGGEATGGEATGGVGGKATGGAGGKATGGAGGTAGAAAGGQSGSAGARTGGAGGGGGRGGAAGAGGASGASSGGTAGAAATCPGKCDANADCRITAGAAVCTCKSGFVGDGQTCARPISCNELHQAAPNLASGQHVLKPSGASAEFTAYCEMAAEGGGWTLVLNEGPSFDPATQGANVQCYRQSCTSLAYSTVLLGSDVMLDVRDGAIVAANYVARVVITGVEARSRSKTVRALFRGGPFYLEKEDNSNVSVTLSGNGTCSETFTGDFGRLACDSCAGNASCSAPVFTFGDADVGCVEDPMFAFAIGGSENYTTGWGNCAGWPQEPNPSDVNHYPDNFRVWVR
jgi:hypothetical protein